jgi:hypothetical protein
VDWLAVAHPKTNGQVERANDMILQGLKPRIFKRLDKFCARWVAELPSALWSLRTMPSRATGFTPFFMVHGSKAVLPTNIDYGSPQVRAYTEEGNQVTLVVGDSPRGPLKQLGNPHLKPATKTKHNLPNPAGNRPTPQGPRRPIKAAPLRDPLEQAPPRSRMRAPSGRLRPVRGAALPSSGLRLARGLAPPRAGSASLEGTSR